MINYYDLKKKNENVSVILYKAKKYCQQYIKLLNYLLKINIMKLMDLKFP